MCGSSAINDAFGAFGAIMTTTFNNIKYAQTWIYSAWNYYAHHAHHAHHAPTSSDNVKCSNPLYMEQLYDESDESEDDILIIKKVN